MSDSKDQPNDATGLGPSRCSTVYLCGTWQDYGPGYNDTYFIVDFVTSDKAKAFEVAAKFPGRGCVMEANDGTSFMGWRQHKAT
jgi:hypothetical protein